MSTTTTEHVDQLLDSIHQQSEPVKLSALRDLAKPLFADRKLSREELDQELKSLLDQQVSAGRLFRFQAYGAGGERYWDRDLQHYARSTLLNTLEEKGDLTAKELYTAVKSRLADLSETQIGKLRNELVREGDIREFPKPTRSRERFGIATPNPAAYVRPHLNKIFGAELKKLEPFGLTFSALATSTLEELASRTGTLTEEQQSLIQQLAATLKAPAPRPTEPADEQPPSPAQPQSPSTDQPSNLTEKPNPRDLVRERLTVLCDAHPAGVSLRELQEDFVIQDAGLSQEELRTALTELQTEGNVFEHPGNPTPPAVFTLTPPPQTTPATPSPVPQPLDLEQALLQAFGELKQLNAIGRFHVPVYELRAWIARNHGEEHASHHVLDREIENLYRHNLRLEPINNTASVPREQLEMSIQGMNDVLFYLEETP